MACCSSVLLSSVMEVVMVAESRRMPRKVRVVDGPSSFSGFVGTPMVRQRAFVAALLRSHSSEFPGPAVKKSSK